jgi:HTH-type transcriptional regulator / antitoxin HipB
MRLPDIPLNMPLRTQPIATASQLGAVLQSARKSRKLTQAQLGARLGLSQKRMSDLELAPGTLSVDQLLAVCNQLGLVLSIQPRDDTPRSTTSPATDW